MNSRYEQQFYFSRFRFTYLEKIKVAVSECQYYSIPSNLFQKLFQLSMFFSVN